MHFNDILSFNSFSVKFLNTVYSNPELFCKENPRNSSGRGQMFNLICWRFKERGQQPDIKVLTGYMLYGLRKKIYVLRAYVYRDKNIVVR